MAERVASPLRTARPHLPPPARGTGRHRSGALGGACRAAECPPRAGRALGGMDAPSLAPGSHGLAVSLVSLGHVRSVPEGLRQTCRAPFLMSPHPGVLSVGTGPRLQQAEGRVRGSSYGGPRVRAQPLGTPATAGPPQRGTCRSRPGTRSWRGSPSRSPVRAGTGGSSRLQGDFGLLPPSRSASKGRGDPEPPQSSEQTPLHLTLLGELWLAL